MFSLRVALRYLFSKKSHNAVNVISIISMLGVGVATAAIVCVLSVFNGFTDLAQSRMSAYNPPLKLIPAQGKAIERGDSLASLIASLDEIESACPTISEQGLAIFDGAQMAVDMRGLPKGYEKIVDLSELIIDGGFHTTDSEIPIATLSVGTAMRLHAFPGEERLIGMYVPKRTGRINTANPMASFRSDSLFIGGVFRSDDKDLDTRSVFLPIETVRSLLEYDSEEATAIEIKPAEGVDEATATAAIQKIAPKGMIVQNRFEQEAGSYRMIAVEKWITFVMLTFILVIASFNVITTLSMLIIEKTPNMTTMRALGATPSMIRRIFMLEGWLITFIGGLIGIVLGAILVMAQQYGGFIRLNGDPSMLTIEVYPVRLDAVDLLIVIALIAIIGFVVGSLTSRFAARR